MKNVYTHGPNPATVTLTVTRDGVAYSTPIDIRHIERARCHTWRATTEGDGAYSRVYFVTTIRKPDGRQTTMRLNRFIAEIGSGSLRPRVNATFKERERADYRKSNLRPATIEQTAQSARKRRFNNDGQIAESKYKGVGAVRGGWRARVQAGKRRITAGVFPFTLQGEIEAARAYNVAAKELHGEFAQLNVITRAALLAAKDETARREANIEASRKRIARMRAKRDRKREAYAARKNPAFALSA